MKNIVGILTLSLLLLSCQNKSRQEYEPTMIETESEESYQQPDTAVTPVQEEATKTKEKPSAPVSSSPSSSSHSSSSSSYDRSATKGRPPREPDNMRGFDPASEDDMEDNGMSRYMENNDDSGWD